MPAALGHRERFLRSIEYKEIDRVPIFYRAEPVVNEKVRKQHDLKDYNDILAYYDADAIQTNVIRSSRYYGSEKDENGVWSDFYGNKFKSVQYGEIWSSTVVEPVLGDTDEIDDIYTKVRWPGKDFVDVDESVKAAAKARESGLAVYGGMWASLFTVSRSIMGEESFLISTIANPEFVEKLVERLTDYFIEVNEAYFSACAKYIDIFYFGSDFGTQASMFISRDAFRRFFKPSFMRLAGHAKGFGLKVMYHTCGAVSEIVPDLIECGIDILDPVQVSAANMEPKLLADKFKGKIAFHGGISSQKTLPFGTPDEVRKEVIRAIETFGPLGYIASPDQDMIGDIPVENINIMFDTIRNYKLGGL